MVGKLRLPSVSDPKTWKSIGVDLSEPWHVTQLPLLGWIVIFFQVSTGPANPVITPATLPTDAVDSSDKSLNASVILPENGVFKQYWVPVLEQYHSARLDTANWTVFFLRTPMA